MELGMQVYIASNYYLVIWYFILSSKYLIKQSKYFTKEYYWLSRSVGHNYNVKKIMLWVGLVLFVLFMRVDAAVQVVAVAAARRRRAAQR